MPHEKKYDILRPFILRTHVIGQKIATGVIWPNGMLTYTPAIGVWCCFDSISALQDHYRSTGTEVDIEWCKEFPVMPEKRI